MTTHQQYRPDIDGLRAVSVIGVMIFHFFPAVLPGGFTAVDLFFVISGYVVTKSILTDLHSGDFSLKGFYARRIRRIIPATLPVYYACFLFGAVFTLTEDFSEVGERSLYGIGMIKNFFLMNKSEYFAQATELNPFTHYWSLSIEEQFYLLWPLLIVTSWHYARKWFWQILAGVFILSLSLNLFLIGDYPKLTFYLLPTRMWELVAGALLCVSGDRFRLPKRQQDYLSGVTLLILAGTFIFLESNLQYPGWRALFPVMIGVLYISTPDAFLNRLLSGKWPVRIGLMSFSLYLWHWPILSFFNTLYPSQMTSLDLFLLFVATLFLGDLSYRLVEAPAKKLTETRAARIFLSGLAVTAIIAALIAASENRLVIHPSLEEKAAGLEDFDGEVHHTPEFCKQSTIRYCIVADPERPPTVALMGDSHASHWLPGLKKFYAEKGENLVMLMQEQTPPFLGVGTPGRNPEDMLRVFRMVNQTPGIHTVILSAFWAVYANEVPFHVGKEFMKRQHWDPSLKNASQQRHFSLLLSKTLWSLQKAKKKIIFVHDVPTTPFIGDKFMPRPFFETSFPVCIFTESLCIYGIDRVITTQLSYRKITNAVLRGFPEVKVLDPVPLFCDEGSGLCLSHPNGAAVYSDEHHISMDGSKYLIPKLFKSER